MARIRSTVAGVVLLAVVGASCAAESELVQQAREAAYEACEEMEGKPPMVSRAIIDRHRRSVDPIDLAKAE